MACSAPDGVLTRVGAQGRSRAGSYEPRTAYVNRVSPSLHEVAVIKERLTGPQAPSRRRV